MPSLSKPNITLTSHDGEKVFHLYGDQQGAEGVHLLEKPVGLMDTPLDTSWMESVNGVGAFHTGVKFPPRDVQLPLFIKGSDEHDVLSAESALRMAVTYDADSTLSITTDLSGTRYLKCRLYDTPQVDLSNDPTRPNGMFMVMTLRAANPLWQGEEVRHTWQFDGRNFYDEITVDNPGDMPLHPRYILPAPTSVVLSDIDYKKGVHHWVTMPWQAPGQDVLVDTNPEVEEAVCDGYPMWLATVPDHFQHPIPPHMTGVKVPIVMNPFPFADALMAAAGIPTRLPQRFIVNTAKALSGQMASFTPEEAKQMDTDTLADKIAGVVQQAADYLEAAATDLTATITAATVGQLIKATYKVIPALAGQSIQLVAQPQFSRPWGV